MAAQIRAHTHTLQKQIQGTLADPPLTLRGPRAPVQTQALMDVKYLKIINQTNSLSKIRFSSNLDK